MSKEEKQKKKERLIRYFVGIIFSASLITTIFLGIYKKEISMGNPIAITSILFIASLLAFFGKNLSNMFKKEESEMPDPLTKEEIREKIEEEAKNCWNNLLRKPIKFTRTKNINKNVIYAFRIKMEIDNEEFIIIINATYPKIEPSVKNVSDFIEDGKLNMVKLDYWIDKEMNGKSLNPVSEPDTEESETKLDEFGRPIQKTKKTTHKPKEEKKKESVA